MNKVLLIGAGPLQMPAFLAAKRRGLHIVGVDRDRAAISLAHADKVYPLDTRDVEGIVKVAREERVDAVLAICTDFPVLAMAGVAQALSIPGLSRSAAERCRHKGRMRDALAQAGVPIPRYCRTKTPEEARSAMSTIGPRVILKPATNSGSRGIGTVRSSEGILPAFARASAASFDGEVLVEELEEGPEVSVESLSFEGRHEIVAITDKRTSGEPHWIEIGHVQPSRLDEAAVARIRALAAQGLTALGVDNAAGHTEIKLGRNGPRIIEIGARLGGDYISTELVPRSTGVDMVEGALDIALGKRPLTTPRHARAAAIRYVLALPGEVVSISGDEASRALPGVVRVELNLKAGDIVRPLTSSDQRLGFVICEGDDPERVEQESREAAESIEILTRTPLTDRRL